MEDYYLIKWTDDLGSSHTLRFNSPGNSSAIALHEALKASSKVKKDPKPTWEWHPIKPEEGTKQ